MGGVSGTSNVLGGKLFGVPVSGTMAHAFVTSFVADDDLHERYIGEHGVLRGAAARVARRASGAGAADLLRLAGDCRAELGFADTNRGSVGRPAVGRWRAVASAARDSELLAFVSFAVAFPGRWRRRRRAARADR